MTSLYRSETAQGWLAALRTCCVAFLIALLSPHTARGQTSPCEERFVREIFNRNAQAITIYVPGLGRTVTAPIGVRIAPVPPAIEGNWLTAVVRPETGSWSYGQPWLDAAFPTEDARAWYVNGNVVIGAGNQYRRTCEWLAHTLSTKVIYKFDGYMLESSVPNAAPQDVFASYLASRRDTTKYMYIEFYDAVFNVDHYTYYTQNGQVTTGAMILPLVPPTPEILAYRRQLLDRARQARDSVWAGREQTIRDLFAGLVVSVLVAGAYSMSKETLGEHIAREREECRRVNANQASGGSLC